MDRGAWGAKVYGVTESDMPKHVHTHTHRVITRLHSLFMGTVYSVQYLTLSMHSLIFEK